MSHFEIDFEKGPHAASGLTYQQLEQIHRIVTLEMAVRMNREDFIELLEMLADARKQHDDVVDQVRRDRDLMHFEASVLADLEKLSVTPEEEGSSLSRNPNEGYGLYL